MMRKGGMVLPCCVKSRRQNSGYALRPGTRYLAVQGLRDSTQVIFEQLSVPLIFFFSNQGLPSRDLGAIVEGMMPKERISLYATLQS